MTNIRAVSELAGVSVATVSRTFTDPDKVAESTRSRVLDAARLLNYKPNSLAKFFRRKQTNTVIVIVPDLANAFFASVLAGIESVASEHDLSVLLCDSHDDPEVERSAVEFVQTRRADGVIQLGARTLKELVDEGETADIPFVHAIEAPTDSTRPSVRIDNVRAAERMTAYIIEQGHARIGVVAGRQASQITALRLEGCRRALEAAGLSLDASAVEYAPFSVSGGALAARKLLGRRPDVTALFCMSDDLAIGAMHAARRLGRRLPRDLSVSGFDNIALGEYMDPPLTTVTQPARRMGETAMHLMIGVLDRIMNGRPALIEPKVLSADLVIRESVQPPAGVNGRTAIPVQPARAPEPSIVD